MRPPSRLISSQEYDNPDPVMTPIELGLSSVKRKHDSRRTIHMNVEEREVTTQGARPPVLLSVQALRGLAALLVLMFHIYEMQRIFLIEHPDTPAALAGPLSTGFWAQGYAGVDLFFLISGFIMVYITAHQPSGWRTARQFIWSRFTRIYPLWFLFCTILAVQYFVRHGVPVDEAIPGYDGNYPLYLIKSLLLIPQSALPILGLGWTLIHEMFFYFGFTVRLLLPKKFRYVALPFWGYWLWGFSRWGSPVRLLMAIQRWRRLY